MTAEDYESCENCPYYEKITKKILIIKIGAMGDVIRTTTILPELKKKYGNDTKIVWVVNQESKDLLKNNMYIDQILTYGNETALRLQQEKFDVFLSLEVAPPGTLLANLVTAKEKYGLFFDSDGCPSAFNKESIPYLNTVFSNKTNKKTKRTYQEAIFEICKLKYNKQPYILSLDEEEKDYAKKLLKHKGEKLIGINIGAGGRWKSKSWHTSKILELIKLISIKSRYNIVLLGGKQEDEIKKYLIKNLKNVNINILQNDSNNTVREFMSVIDLCEVIITNDSLALHLAIGLNKKTIALFFCTPGWQVESYNIVKKIESPLLEKYFMDDQYHEDLVNSISAEQVFKEI
ncbi:MAG: glycosyltransferase family 9 protein [Nanoarchaeota archaeon]